MSNEEKKGFSGIDDLLSDMSDSSPAPSVESGPKEKRSESKVLPENRARPEETKSSVTNNTSDAEPVDMPKMKAREKNNGNSSNAKNGLIVLAVLVFLVLLANQESSNTNHKNSYSPVNSTSSVPKEVKGPRYEKPPVGSGQVLGLPELRWCVREGMRVDFLRSKVSVNSQVTKFNELVGNHNSRCGNFRYREGLLARAEREVESYRNQIEKAAIEYGVSHGLLENKSTSAPRPNNSEGKKKELYVNSQLTLEAQDILNTLGYSAGVPDGIYGPNTIGAVKEFQRDIGIEADGIIDRVLLNKLKSIMEARKAKTPEERTNKKAESSSYSSARVNPITHISRGTLESDVLRIQGTPSDIDTYKVSGYKIWRYGLSSIKISLHDQRVLSWQNNGNLKVRMEPGANATNSSYISRGSHTGDVLRVQGTPNNIDTYKVSGYEIWRYGLSSIKISLHDQRVISWQNLGNLRVQQN
ncbi:peptidoglycan-binding domain-containing protein [Methylophaga sp.]|uniref:peptidoglycan-binding domain-containing protein n=1 Tax=Methylophaga sp. TaxID=2024840 RepID=UPI003A8D015E